ncbi:MAG: DUF2889 domain-containing protein [Deltaproteobacteria bacterium]|nr:DUF2889 domain-containing protein [Deltaproteobacteria bacterium]
MDNGRFRRLIDSTVKTAGRERVSVDVCVSDGCGLLFTSFAIQFPELRIVKARMESFGADQKRDPAPCVTPLPELEGIDAGPGYIKKVKKALQGRDVPDALLDALVETARMTGQIGMLAPEELEGLDFSDPKTLRRLDLTHWPQLENGCIPYSSGMQDRFQELGVKAASRPDIYAPDPDQVYRFRRSRIFECRIGPESHVLQAYMNDDIHELEIEIRLAPGERKIEGLEARSYRSPYPGICNQPFPRVAALAGTLLDSTLSGRLHEAVGVSDGCVHLKDLILDEVRYYRRVIAGPARNGREEAPQG